ncbi:Predicted Fe-Mo cluster-binding protein, NifX family [Desulfonispora thiosulfatigenes DSM 11270]|uniref:Predicted Fe-Mo cluster-binding protein, NifX family n=1 Tax=Desulfonispora thiosulfatigenes DSM 11270 TaxID=656914 RepID=A0A1W1V420_DESTI|nr:NifB/NifX family molybdenum-iron cluster-binding protein [Desulfonispora thiosulfatigenes]SMB88030.1 Predicted Fe-Mo cluster-binding protein, NifX family [Desulfonispora thiosulfatigenes DSM 11270]
MKIAIPVANELLCMHFGHCEQFAMLDVNEETKQIKGKEMITPPPHEPGLLPVWIKDQGVDLVLAGGMGKKAQELLAERGIKVVVGAPSGTPEEIALAYLNKELVTGQNACDH